MHGLDSMADKGRAQSAQARHTIHELAPRVAERADDWLRAPLGGMARRAVTLTRHGSQPWINVSSSARRDRAPVHVPDAMLHHTSHAQS